MSSTVGEVKDIKKLRSGDLLIQTATSLQSSTLEKLTQLGTLPITTSLHKGLNFSRGVISQKELLSHSEMELVANFAAQKVCPARRINIRRDGKLLPTQHVVFTFSTPQLPKSIKAGYLN
ncbi:hypothetical protein AVEN_101887-1 [Araneus ventricosus]|uniref:Uncharacterized protein n=1 Tax=Araneus ventricosus TaxID=182803 RepID=A0A4Y2DA78_ARAVE|nr:hypothetical protein AVEN_240654-1 [Araneus ventricosus]GBM13027.1 hypothetical protein AVEN_101887-1 [Araneus ventricosus]